jgi:transcription elongation factor GreA
MIRPRGRLSPAKPVPGAPENTLAEQGMSGVNQSAREFSRNAMTDKVPMTPGGAQKLREELTRLKEERPKISREIGIAREHGDLSENAEYHAAKERQGLVEARIKDIEDKLSRAEVIDPSKLSGDRVRFGAKVTLTNLDTDEESKYRIVGADEADVDQGLISVTAPLARALIGKTIGDEVVVNLPAGKRRYEIGGVEFQ